MPPLSPSPAVPASALPHTAPATPAGHGLPAWVPHGAGLRLEDVLVCEDEIALQVATIQASSMCPRCGQASTVVHSRYGRTIADLSWGTARVVLHLAARRFRCQQRACPRRIFCERLPALVPVYGRETHGVREVHERLGFALGGRPGARLATRLRLGTSRMTLLRRVRAAAEPPTSAAAGNGAAPRVLGVDDWAKRKGHTYGTILVDLEQRCPIDLLPDRTAEALATWLQAHPGTEILCRDRAGAYAEGARHGAPEAMQVADRWHLLANLRTAVERLVTRHHAALSESSNPIEDGGAARTSAVSRSEAVPPDQIMPLAEVMTSAEPERAAAVTMPVPNALAPLPVSPPPPTMERVGRPPATAPAVPIERNALPPSPSLPSTPSTPARRPRDLALQQARRARRIARYEAVAMRRGQGKSLRTIASELGLNRKTVLRFVQAAESGGFPERQPRGARPTQLAGFDAYLRERWAAGSHNALALWNELRANGYTGGKTSVRDHVQSWRAAPIRASRCQTTDAAERTSPPSPTGATAKPAVVPRSVRDVTWLLVRRPDDLTRDEQTYITSLARRCPELGIAHGLVQDVAALIRDRARWAPDTTALTSWVRVAMAAGIPELRSFATGLLRDWRAVQAGVSSSWSNGQTEGQVNRLKLLKRQMFGRAKFDLLRKRVLARP